MTSAELFTKIQRVIPASRERVFKAWVDPEKLKQWWGPEGVKCLDAEVDLTVGGTYRLTLLGKSRVPFSVAGSYLEIKEPERLVFTWDWEDEDLRLGHETQVKVEFIDQDGSTEVIITHSKFPNQEVRDAHEGGWTSLLTKLEAMHS